MATTIRSLARLSIRQAPHWVSRLLDRTSESLKWSVASLAAAAWFAWLTFSVEQAYARPPLANVSLAFSAVALAHAVLGPDLLGKCHDGTRSSVARLVLWPYLVLSRALLVLRRLVSALPEHTLVTPQLIIGRCPSRRDARRLETLGVSGVLDLSAELSTARLLRQRRPYLSVPLLRSRAPTLEELRRGIQYMIARSRTGPVLVHCAQGGSRSGLFAAAYLLATGESRGPAAAVETVRSARPSVRLDADQYDVLHRFFRALSGSVAVGMFPARRRRPAA